jgi:hypothetical protein
MWSPSATHRFSGMSEKTSCEREATKNQADRSRFSAELATRPRFQMFAFQIEFEVARETRLRVPREVVNAKREVVYAGDASGFPFSTT